MFLLWKYSTFTPKMQGGRMGTSGRIITKSTSVSGEVYKLEQNDGSQSDTAVGTVGTGGKKRRSSLSAKVVAMVSRRSRSTSQLSQTGEWDKCSRIIEVSEKKLFSCGPMIQSLVSTMKYCKIRTLEFCFAHYDVHWPERYLEYPQCNNMFFFKWTHWFENNKQ